MCIEKSELRGLKRQLQQGYAMLEAMLGLFVLGVGLLGMASLQNKAVRLSNTAHLYSQSTYLASSIIERARANRDELDSYAVGFNDTVTASTDCASSSCTEAQLAKWDLVAWLNDLAELLPQGDGEVTVSGSDITVIVRFDDDMGGQSSANSAASNVKDGLVELQVNSRI